MKNNGSWSKLAWEQQAEDQCCPQSAAIVSGCTISLSWQEQVNVSSEVAIPEVSTQSRAYMNDKCIVVKE